MPALPIPRRPNLVLAAAALCLIALPAEARRSATAKPAPDQAAELSAPAQGGASGSASDGNARGATPNGAWTAGESAKADCTRVRRKLWQPGEGWLVRTVSFCR